MGSTGPGVLDLRPGALDCWPGVRGRFRSLQALDDAIAYRRARATSPCPDCRAAPPGARCDDHARDLDLITEYQHDAMALAAALTANRTG